MLLFFVEEELRNLFDLKIFIDVERDIRLARRIKRDIEERGRNLEFVLYHGLLLLGKEKKNLFCRQKDTQI